MRSKRRVRLRILNEPTSVPRLDDIDLKLIDALRKDGRTPNKTLARELGIAETTVASRIRQLRADKVMLVTLRRDLYSSGYEFQCLTDVYVSNRSPQAVADDLAALDGVSSVSLTLGSPEIIAVFNARDRTDLLDRLNGDFAKVRGIARVEIYTALDIRKYQTGYADLRQIP